MLIDLMKYLLKHNPTHLINKLNFKKLPSKQRRYLSTEKIISDSHSAPLPTDLPKETTSLSLFKDWWDKLENIYKFNKKERPFAYKLGYYTLFTLMGGYVANRVNLHFDRRKENLATIQDAKNHGEEHWTITSKYLDNLSLDKLVMEARLYRYNRPNPEDLDHHPEIQRELKHYLEKNERLQVRIQAMNVGQFFNSEIVRQRKEVLNDLCEKKHQLEIALKINESLYLYKLQRYPAAKNEIDDVIETLTKNLNKLIGVNKKLDKSDKGKIEKIKSTLGIAYIMQAKVFKSLEKDDDALKSYNHAMVYLPNDAITISSKGALQNDMKKILEADREAYDLNLSNALKNHRRAYELNPFHPTILTAYGWCLYELSKEGCKLYLLPEVPNNNEPNYKKYYNSYIFTEKSELFYVKKGAQPEKILVKDIKKFKETLNQVMGDTKSKRLTLEETRNLITANGGDIPLKKEALALYSKILDTDSKYLNDSKYINTFLFRGILYFDNNNLTKALSDFDKALALDAYHPNALRRRGMTLIKLGCPDEAIEALRKAEMVFERLYAEHGSIEFYKRLKETQKSISEAEIALTLKDNQKSEKIQKDYMCRIN